MLIKYYTPLIYQPLHVYTWKFSQLKKTVAYIFLMSENFECTMISKKPKSIIKQMSYLMSNDFKSQLSFHFVYNKMYISFWMWIYINVLCSKNKIP